jgi:hypothetical protein
MTQLNSPLHTSSPTWVWRKAFRPKSGTTPYWVMRHRMLGEVVLAVVDDFGRLVIVG